MLCRFYLRRGVVYIPTLGKIDKGFYRSIEPVAVVPMSNTGALRRALLDTIERGNPTIPRLKQGQRHERVTLKYAGVKNWSAFERGTSCWAMEEDAGIFRIVAHRKAEQGWEEDEDRSETFPQGTSAIEVVDRMIEILLAESQKRSR
jgi:hypothetical protein